MVAQDALGFRERAFPEAERKVPVHLSVSSRLFHPTNPPKTQSASNF